MMNTMQKVIKKKKKIWNKIQTHKQLKNQQKTHHHQQKTW